MKTFEIQTAKLPSATFWRMWTDKHNPQDPSGAVFSTCNLCDWHIDSVGDLTHLPI